MGVRAYMIIRNEMMSMCAHVYDVTLCSKATLSL